MSYLQSGFYSADFVNGVPIKGLPHSEPDSPYGLSDELRQQIIDTMKPWQQASVTLQAEPPASSTEVSNVASECRQMVYKAEAASHELAPDDPHSLYWAQVLASAWTCLGWAEHENKESGVAEIYLRSAWALSQSKMSGYQLARVLQAKGDKKERRTSMNWPAYLA